MPEEEGLEEQASARSFWSGTLTFGLVSVPVALFPAQRSVRVSLRMLSPEGVPLRREYYDPDTDKRIDGDRIVRGYEIADDEYVVVTDAELEGLAPERTRDIDLRLFVDRAAIDPAYFDRAYFLTPAGDSTKAYRLLAATMERMDRAGIATFVMRGKEYLVAILAENGILRAETLRFADELRSPEDVDLPEPPKVKSADVQRFERAIRKLASKTFEPDELHDRAAERLRKLIERKQQSGEDVRIVEESPASRSSDVIDLMEVLKRSMAAAGGADGSGGRKAAKRAGRGGGTRSGGSAKRSSAKPAGGGDLAALSKEELYERAQQLDVPGRSGMTKRQLIAALQKAG